ncbi:hypothetical protein LMG18102_00005 [Ralstonia mannitolilytica]|uniref:TagK domain-containing protein n=1 Tax=Ralstonia mannitolilytica TaxID=105219 RepID=UPI0028F5D218|nr:TagK domain-containing protein [Ralstonia mannitolilytica]CAJ0683464.1 hypothetical protein LMG18102_00005 [Ralstonia mannitolilytica]CAJ0741490.1 hypothetical protein R76696_03494 [Ralstonia mannitolilytica]
MSNEQQHHPSTDGILDDLIPSSGPPAWEASADGPFAALRINSATARFARASAALEPDDVLRKLSREAEIALQNPELAAKASAPLAPPKGVGDMDSPPARTLSGLSADGSTGTLLDMLAGAASIENLIGDEDSLDSHHVLAKPSTPDVLHLFAGNIVVAERRGITAALTKREHHLISMDSAYLPVTAQPPESGPHGD